MKKSLFLTLIIITALSFVSCSLEKQCCARVSALSKNNSNIDFYVVLESPTGLCMNAANVFLTDTNNCIQYFTFNNNKQRYECSVENADGIFCVQVDSALMENTKYINVPHYKLKSKPVVKVFCDSEGNSVLSGATLNNQDNITIAWNSLGENVVYTVTVRNSVNTIYEVSTDAANVLIPANTLEKSNMLYLTISAQRINGDLSFRTCDFYSVSKIEGSSICFTTR